MTKQDSSSQENKASRRIDFKSGVPDTLYRQANGHCSVPRCKLPTMGPYYQSPGAVNMGKACHIYSASENGPRGWGGKLPEFISSEENGIWCCAYHSDLVDKNHGNDYPTHVLFAWKALAEARVQKLMIDTPSPLGWVESIKFTEFPGANVLPQIKLSRYTLLEGKNESGKTILLQAAASISQSRYASRFLVRPEASAACTVPPPIRAEVNYSTVDSLSKDLHLSMHNGGLTRSEGAVACLLPPGDLEVIYCSISEMGRQVHEDDIDLLMRVLNVDESALRALCSNPTKMTMPGKIRLGADTETDNNGNTVSRLKENGTPYYCVSFRKANSTYFEKLTDLSASSERRLILDLQLAKAREVNKQRLTLLLIEDLVLNFDEENFSSLLDELALEDFQVLVVIPPVRTGSILNQEGDRITLKDREYLKRWRLQVLAGGV